MHVDLWESVTGLCLGLAVLQSVGVLGVEQSLKFRRLTRPVLEVQRNFTPEQLKKIRAMNKPSIDGPIRGGKPQPPDAGKLPGEKNVQIVGGTLSYRGQFPWQAAIEIDGSSFCGGSLISETIVLTAAHCSDSAKKFFVLFGAQNIDKREKNRITMLTRKKKLHPLWNRNLLVNDIAFLRLPRKVRLSNFIKLVRLPSTAMAEQTMEGISATISGWGRTSNAATQMSSLQYHVVMKMVDIAQCVKVYGDSNYTKSLCVLGPKKKGTCEGDSGGPLVYKESDGLWTQIGVVSYGASEGCAKGFPDVFTRVASYLSWLNTNAGISVRTEPPTTTTVTETTESSYDETSPSYDETSTDAATDYAA